MIALWTRVFAPASRLLCDLRTMWWPRALRHRLQAGELLQS